MQLRLLPFSAGPIFALIFWGACASWILPKVVAWRVKRSTDSSMARDQGSLNLVAVLWWSGIAMDFSLSLLLRQAAISWKRTSFFFVGICFMLLGIALRWYSTVIACSPASQPIILERRCLEHDGLICVAQNCASQGRLAHTGSEVSA
jgi:hypothetical protein